MYPIELPQNIKIIEPAGEIEKSTIIIGDFNTYLSMINTKKSTKIKIFE